jgi:hypothetical protein
MRVRSGRPRFALIWIMATVSLPNTIAVPLKADEVTLQSLVTPSTIIVKDQQPVRFAVYGFIEFRSLSELFTYIQQESRRWQSIDHSVDTQLLSRQLLRRGIESRVISMTDERPLQTLLTHTSDELREAIALVKDAVPPGYTEEFLAVQKKWSHSLNCWSASPSIPGRVLSNWYLIEEGINLYGATYDSTEHFWQAVKYHPDVTAEDLGELISLLEKRDWHSWIESLRSDPKIYLSNAYAVEFLRHNLARERLRWFAEQIRVHGIKSRDHIRSIQQRKGIALRFSALEEKILWGDLADLFHLVYEFSSPDDLVRMKLAEHHFNAIHLEGEKLGFISEEFRSRMFEIWKVKYLEMPRFRKVIASIPGEIRLEHFLNDGDSPDIPIPVYVSYLNRMRELARAKDEP